jgi:hypothetical protein
MLRVEKTLELIPLVRRGGSMGFAASSASIAHRQKKSMSNRIGVDDEGALPCVGVGDEDVLSVCKLTAPPFATCLVRSDGRAGGRRGRCGHALYGRPAIRGNLSKMVSGVAFVGERDIGSRSSHAFRKCLGALVIPRSARSLMDMKGVAAAQGQRTPTERQAE